MPTISGEYAIPTPSRTPAAPITIEVFAQTDVGLTRDHNEDTFLVANLSGGEPLQFPNPLELAADRMGTLFMVADGMGGAAAGEIASATAVDVVLRHLRRALGARERATAPEFAGALSHATETANWAIFHYASQHPELRGMGTTATIAALQGDTLFLAQVGDSRAYLVRGHRANQLTKDQSLMQKLIEAGELTEEEAALSERRNIILQALGPEPFVKVDLTHQRVARGDVLILCSDGLSGLVRGDEIADVVSEEMDLSVACDRLVALANDRGGPDNVTVVAVRFSGPALAEPMATDSVGHRAFVLEGDEDETPVAARPKAAPPKAGAQVKMIPPADGSRRQRGVLYSRLIAAAGILLLLLIAWQLLRDF